MEWHVLRRALGLLLLLEILLTLRGPTPAESASLYGASHLKVPLQDAQSTTYIYFKFRTSRPSAFLFLAAGSSDYCLLVLEDGDVKVRINLGAGEAVLSSKPGLTLNDLLWHDVELHRTDAELTLIIDSLHTTYLDIPGRFFELNVKYGVFVGGLGSFSELFLGNIPNFRGCIDDVIFNSHDILKMAASGNPESQNAVSITWNCSEEFEALSHQPISFMEKGSFVALPSWNARNGGSVSLDLKTQTHSAVLFYNAGVPSKSDFISLEILDGKTTMSVNEGNGVVVLQSDVVVSDGLWHHVEVQFSQSYIEVVVDEQMKNLRPGLGDNKFFDLAGYFYVGGIELSKQSRALQNGLQSILIDGVESSLKGCVKNIKVNDQLVGFREAEITYGVLPDCVWEYMCLQEPCVPRAECYQDGVDSFRCICDADTCIRANFSSGYKLYTKSSKPIDLEVLELYPLVISEGGSDLITSSHIKVILDYLKYGIRESGVLFHIIEPPKYGTLEIEIFRRIADNIFTLLDLNTDKVRYSHDGSESRTDTIVFDLEFRAKNFRLPSFLEEKHRFVFHMQIQPVNDPPKLKLTPGTVFRLAKNTKKTITSDFLTAEDPDNSPSELVYTVLNLGSTESEAFIENNKNPGKPISSFTQAEIDDGVISYANMGTGNTRLTIQVSDGIQSDQTATIRIVPFDLKITLMNNTGIVLPYNTFALITADNLTFVDNSPEQNLEIRYDISKIPLYGSVQRLRNNNKWYTVNHFTQRQMKKEKLRYLHTTDRPSYDEFKFTVTCMNMKLPNTYDFRVTFIAIVLKQVHSAQMLLNKRLDCHISERELKFETQPIATSPDLIVFTLVTLPIYGNLIQFHLTDAEPRHKKLEIGNTFTQTDLASKRIKYKLHRKSYSAIEDSFTFRVTSPGGISSEITEFKLKHTPSDTEAIIINEKVKVVEGGTSTIGPSELSIEVPSGSVISYNISVSPKHGVLKKLKADLAEVEDDAAQLITSEEVKQNRLIYVHDDSENERDIFHFVASAVDDSNIDSFVYYGTVHIHVIMKNDNPPHREIDKLFNVVLDGERKLTGFDLKYVDPDIDSSPAEIQYTRRGIPNGDLFHVDDTSTQIYEFTQSDLNAGKIVFRHHGPPYGKAVLRITDGKFYATGVLEIHASKPYIKITQNTGLVVKRGENGLLTATNLTVDTNVDANSDDITYKITSLPKHGEMLVNGRLVNQFTQKDLMSENVEYENDNSVSFRDSFSFSAFLEDNTVEGKFDFFIYPEIYWEPLRVMKNETLHVDEEKIVTINSNALNISQVNISPNNISYVVTVPPRFGFLVIGNVRDYKDWKSVAKTSPAKEFTQAVINEGRLHYFHSEKNVSEDFFVFEVSNGITTLTGLMFHFRIISKIIFLKTSNITVIEGSEVPLKSGEIGVTNPYYADWITEYLVIEKPQHGFISYVKNSRSKILRFSASNLRSGLIHYVHDGSETTRDWFTLVANATALNKESSPSTIHVTVEPVNDETPHVVNNTGLDVWEGDVTTITNQHLAAADDDSDLDDITFVISSPSNGYVSLKNDTKTPILSFTQAQIDRGRIVFVHTGDKAGGFKLQVNDGVNYDSPHVFTITARALQIILATNEKLSILPRIQQSITKDHLFVTTNDHDLTRVIDFRITRGPSLGRLLVENPDGTLTTISRFNQDQINRNLVLYEHNKPMVGLTSVDMLTFDIETQNAKTMKDVTFRIEISVGNFGAGNLELMVNLHTLEVKEGGFANIGQEHIDMSRLFSLWQGKGKSEFAKKLKIIVLNPPVNGWLETEDSNSTIANFSFTREDIRKKRVHYYHDDSDTFNDNFTIGFYLVDEKGIPDILLFNGTVNVTVYPVNDNPFKLLTRTVLREVVEGRSLVLNPHILNVSDSDGVPKDIVYETIKSPSSGKLVIGNVSITNFTQEDIDNHLVTYIHDGTKESRSGFSFKVSDGKHKPDYAVLDIVIVPITLHLVNKSAIEVQQGSTAVFLSGENLGAQTNSENETIWYDIISVPRHGHIFVNDDVKRRFRQLDINRKTVFYMQSDLTVSEDYFVITLSIKEKKIENEIVNITVVPNVNQRPLNASASGITWITLDVLNAAKLAEQTGGNPQYLVFTLPKYGVLKKVDPKKRSKRKTSDTFEFTHEDVVSKHIFYEGTDMALDAATVDTFEYMLTAPHVQPAKGKFSIVVQPAIDHRSTTTPPKNTSTIMKLPPPPLVPDIVRIVTISPETAVGGVYQPSISNDHLLIAGVILGVIIISLVIVIVIKCRAIRRENHKERNGHQGNCGGKKCKTVAGSRTAQSDLDLSDPNPSDRSVSLSDEMPPAPPTSPSSSSSHLGCIGGTPKPRTLRRRDKCPDVDPPLPPPPYILENGEWTEVSAAVPTCKVTPIAHEDQEEDLINETTLKVPYFMREPSEGDDWMSRYEGSELRYGPAYNPVLRKNQYWV